MTKSERDELCDCGGDNVVPLKPLLMHSLDMVEQRNREHRQACAAADPHLQRALVLLSEARVSCAHGQLAMALDDLQKAWNETAMAIELMAGEGR